MRTTLILSLSATLLLGTAQTAEDHVSITEWDVPWPETRPRDPAVALDGDIWFNGQAGNYLAHLDVDTGSFRRVDLPEGTHPHNLIILPDGMVWFAGNRDAYVGIMDPASGEITRIPRPREDANDPHTLKLGEDGIWFTLQWSNMVGHLDPETREVLALIEVPTDRARPYGIDIGPDGTPWIALFGTHKLARVDRADGELVEVPLPDETTRPRRLDVAEDGRVWYGDYANGRVGVYDPADASVQTWPLPGGERSLPYAVRLDDSDRFWVVETGMNPNRLVGVDTATGEVLSVSEIPSGAGTVRNMTYDPERRALWFGTDLDTVGKAELP